VGDAKMEHQRLRVALGWVPKAVPSGVLWVWAWEGSDLVKKEKGTTAGMGLLYGYGWVKFA
jgi:hypothetical protein